MSNYEKSKIAEEKKYEKDYFDIEKDDIDTKTSVS